MGAYQLIYLKDYLIRFQPIQIVKQNLNYIEWPRIGSFIIGVTEGIGILLVFCDSKSTDGFASQTILLHYLILILF